MGMLCLHTQPRDLLGWDRPWWNLKSLLAGVPGSKHGIALSLVWRESVGVAETNVPR